MRGAGKNSLLDVVALTFYLATGTLWGDGPLTINVELPIQKYDRKGDENISGQLLL